MSTQTIAILGFLGVLILFVFVLAAMGLRVVSPYQKGVLERLGRFQRVVPAGLTVIIPFLDSLTKVDMREQLVDVPPQEVITKDNVVVTVDAIVYFEATDPVKLTYNVVDFYGASTKLAQTNLRNVVGEMELDEALTSRDKINTKLREVLDDATDKWGVRVVRVEIKRIDPPADVTQAMHRQMKAEREKRAQILDSEGSRASRILQAEGEAEAVRRVADAERYRREVEATGQANALTIVYNAITDANVDQRVIAIQYIDALKVMSNGTATKIFLPYEATALLGAVGGIQEVLKPMQPAPGGAPAAPQRSQDATGGVSANLRTESGGMPDVRPPNHGRE
jgi:regulator of protease activity HflC (stomatin/prohibitin superfamily)